MSPLGEDSDHDLLAEAVQQADGTAQLFIPRRDDSTPVFKCTSTDSSNFDAVEDALTGLQRLGAGVQALAVDLGSAPSG